MIQAQARSFILLPLNTHKSSSGSKLGSGFGSFDCYAFLFAQFILLKACSEVRLSKMDTRGGSKGVRDVVSRGKLKYIAATEDENGLME